MNNYNNYYYIFIIAHSSNDGIQLDQGKIIWNPINTTPIYLHTHQQNLLVLNFYQGKMLLSTILALVLGLTAHLYVSLVAKPTKIQKVLKKQGINGPPPKILLGNILEIKKSRAAAAIAATESGAPALHNRLRIPIFGAMEEAIRYEYELWSCHSTRSFFIIHACIFYYFFR